VVITGLVVGIPALPGASPRAANAATPTMGRVCSGAQMSGAFTEPGQTIRYRYHRPPNSTVSIRGTIDIDRGQLTQANLTVEGGFFNTLAWLIAVGIPSSDVAFSGSRDFGQGDQDPTLEFSNNYIISARFRFVLTVTGATPTGPCTPLAASETLGCNCALPHGEQVQGTVGDPVNTATGNFHEPFSDFSVPGRGPGLGLGHAYNSLRAASPDADGPLGFGWTHSYNMSLRVAQPSGVVTVAQESGAEVSFYPDGAGGYEAPARAVATLARNGDGSYTFGRRDQTTIGFSAAGATSTSRGWATASRPCGTTPRRHAPWASPTTTGMPT